MLGSRMWGATGVLILAVLFQDAFGHEQDFEVPPPQPPPTFESAREYAPVLRETGGDWGLSAAMVERLAEQSARHAEYALRFTCDETVLVARYGGDDSVDKEKRRRFAYFLVRDGSDGSLIEHRRKLDADGSMRASSKGSFKDDDLVPPPFAWWSLFAVANRPYFSFRHVGERAAGFDSVTEIQFRGVLPFDGGRDIREWEGTILVDADGAPVSIVAEPRGQHGRIREIHRRYVQALKIMGISLRRRPLGVRLELEFGTLHEERRFPTRSRVDRFQAVTSARVVPLRASTRNYDNYRFTRVDTDEELGRPSQAP